MKIFSVILVVIVGLAAGLVLGGVGHSMWQVVIASTTLRPTQDKVGAASTAPTLVATPVIDCEKYEQFTQKCVKDYESVRRAIETANNLLEVPTEERDFDALWAVNEIALVGSCADGLIWQIQKYERNVALDAYLGCPSVLLALENDAQILEGLHIVETRSAERCGSIVPCDVCRKVGKTTKSCIGVRSQDERLKIFRKGAASRTILNSLQR